MALIKLSITACDQADLRSALRNLLDAYDTTTGGNAIAVGTTSGSAGDCTPNPVNPLASMKEEAAATADTTPRASFDRGNVLKFLVPGEYQYRTADAVAKHFDVDINDADEMLDDLDVHGLVTTKRRRSDGETLYANPNTPVGAVEATTAGDNTSLNSEDILIFLEDDSSGYRYRTAGAIARALGADPEQVNRELVALERRGMVYTRTRRSDGVILYAAN